jgi:hypothetical protein
VDSVHGGSKPSVTPDVVGTAAPVVVGASVTGAGSGRCVVVGAVVGGSVSGMVFVVAVVAGADCGAVVTADDSGVAGVASSSEPHDEAPITIVAAAIRPVTLRIPVLRSTRPSMGVDHRDGGALTIRRRAVTTGSTMGGRHTATQLTLRLRPSQ